MRNVELIMVTAENNNKFYKMVEASDGLEFTITYGRVGQSGVSETYPISKWDSKYKEKIKKGYKDVTEFKKVGGTGSIKFDDTHVELFYNTFQRYSNNRVNHNYQISSDSVTSLMIKEAQDILNFMLESADKEDLSKFNSGLIDLFTILPRKISNVKNELYQSFDEGTFKARVLKEQDILDSLESQIITTVTSDTNLIDILNCNIVSVNDTERALIEGVINPTNSTQYKIHKAFKVEQGVNHAVYGKFDKWLEVQNDKTIEYLIHGTRNPNIFSILRTGLVLRPTNAVISGAAYGFGVYHSAHSQKSMGYTGYDNDKIFLIQKVHMGNRYTYQGWYRDGKDLSRNQMNYKYLKSKGYDSLYVKPGDGLLNSEYIVYNEEQTVTNFLVWLK